MDFEFKNGKTIATGEITKEPELKYVGQKQTPLLKFSIICDREPPEQPGASPKAKFLDVDIWGKLAERWNGYLIKGDSVLLTGKIQERTDEKGRVWKSLRCDYIDRSDPEGGTLAMPPFPAPAPAVPAGDPSQEFPPIEADDDLPFV